MLTFVRKCRKKRAKYMCCARVQFVFIYFCWYFVSRLCSKFRARSYVIFSPTPSLGLAFVFCSLSLAVVCCTQFTFVKFTCSKNVGICVLYNDRIILMQTSYVYIFDRVAKAGRQAAASGVRAGGLVLSCISFCCHLGPNPASTNQLLKKWTRKSI